MIYVKYSAQYNQKTWQWNVVEWTRTDPLDAWQGRAINGYQDQILAEEETKKLNETVYNNCQI